MKKACWIIVFHLFVLIIGSIVWAYEEGPRQHGKWIEGLLTRESGSPYTRRLCVLSLETENGIIYDGCTNDKGKYKIYVSDDHVVAIYFRDEKIWSGKMETKGGAHINLKHDWSPFSSGMDSSRYWDQGKFKMEGDYDEDDYDWEPDYKGALEDFNKAIEMNPRKAIYYTSRAKAKSKLKDFNGALEDFDKAIKMKPKESFYYYLRAECKAEDMKNYKGALEDYNKMVEIDPDNPSSYLRRIDFKEDYLKDYKGALEDYNKLIELYPKKKPKYHSIYDLYEFRASLKRNKLKDIKGACEDYETIISMCDKSLNNKSNSLILLKRGGVKFIIGDKKGGNADFEKAKKHKDYYESLEYYLGQMDKGLSNDTLDKMFMLDKAASGAGSIKCK